MKRYGLFRKKKAEVGRRKAMFGPTGHESLYTLGLPSPFQGEGRGDEVIAGVFGKSIHSFRVIATSPGPACLDCLFYL